MHRSVNLQNREILISVSARPAKLLGMIPLVCKSSSYITTHFHASASLLPHCRRCQHQACFVSVFAILCLQRQAWNARDERLNVRQAFGKHDLVCATSCPLLRSSPSWRALPSGPDHPYRAAPLAANIPLHMESWLSGTSSHPENHILHWWILGMCPHACSTFWFGVLSQSETSVSYAFCKSNPRMT